MRHLERKDGFTLVELVVGIACAAMVMAAAAALLLMGARIQRTLRDEAKEQQTVRIVLTMLEDLVTEGQIAKVETTDSSWELKDSADTTLLTFENGQLLGVGSSVLLDGLTSAEANLHGNLLNFVFTTDRSTYETSTYCRTTVIRNESAAESTKDTVENSENNAVVGTEQDARYKFLQTLCAEYGSTGTIQNGSDAGKYYSQWYIGDYASNPGWNSSTPWCACFLSWAAAQHFPYYQTEPKPAYIFADVDNGWNYMNTYQRGTQDPTPGDYIFFDWEQDTDPDHVGAVLLVNRGLVYTIEGNSGGRVAIHSYALTDPRIMGYGVLPWA